MHNRDKNIGSVRGKGREGGMDKRKLASFKKKLEKEREVLEKQYRDL